jgi:hypothetical protein
LRWFRSPRSFFILIAASMTAVLCAIASPLVLAAVDRSVDLNWVRLSNIGQAYGAASAALSALAVAGVGASIIYQARAVGYQRQQAVREQQRHLLSLLLADPETYAPAYWSGAATLEPVQLRRRTFVLLSITYLYFGYNSGLYTEKTLTTESLPAIFSTEVGREFWASARVDWLYSDSRQERRFGRIVDENYQKSIREPLDAAPSSMATLSVTRASKTVTCVSIAFGAIGLIAGWSIGRRSRDN